MQRDGTYGNCWVGGMFAKFRTYEQELSLTVDEFEVVVWHSLPRMSPMQASSLARAASMLDDSELSQAKYSCESGGNLCGESG